jgi:DNA-binding XRE family transcriptional regulator
MAERQDALKLLSDLAKSKDDRWVSVRAKRLRDQMQRPMETILRKVPGKTITDKAYACGVSRQAYYAWLRGISRPNVEQAKVLARLTGLTVEQIRGREVYTPPRINPVQKKRKRPSAAASAAATS